MSYLSLLRRRMRRLIAGCAFGLSLGGAAMATPLSEPQAVPLDFLGVFGEGPDWLRGAMTGLGAAIGYSIAKSALVATDQEALVQANRIRSFAEAAAAGRRAPFVLLHLRDAAGVVTDCATFAAKSILPDIEARDFGVAHFAQARAIEGPALEACRIAPGADDFAGQGRDQLRSYFDAAGDLDIEKIALNDNPDFIRALIRVGFYVKIQDFTGRLRIE